MTNIRDIHYRTIGGLRVPMNILYIDGLTLYMKYDEYVRLIQVRGDDEYHTGLCYLSFEYDSHNRLTAEKYSSDIQTSNIPNANSVEYKYDKLGYLCLIETLGERIHITNDELGRPTEYRIEKNNWLIKSVKEVLNEPVEQWVRFRYEGNEMVEYEDSDGNWWDKSVTDFEPCFPLFNKYDIEYPSMPIFGVQ